MGLEEKGIYIGCVWSNQHVEQDFTDQVAGELLFESWEKIREAAQSARLDELVQAYPDGVEDLHQSGVLQSQVAAAGRIV